MFNPAQFLEYVTGLEATVSKLTSELQALQQLHASRPISKALKEREIQSRMELDAMGVSHTEISSQEDMHWTVQVLEHMVQERSALAHEIADLERLADLGHEIGECSGYISRNNRMGSCKRIQNDLSIARQQLLHMVCPDMPTVAQVRETALVHAAFKGYITGNTSANLDPVPMMQIESNDVRKHEMLVNFDKKDEYMLRIEELKKTLDEKHVDYSHVPVPDYVSTAHQSFADIIFYLETLLFEAEKLELINDICMIKKLKLAPNRMVDIGPTSTIACIKKLVHDEGYVKC